VKYKIEKSECNDETRDLLLLADPSEEVIEGYIHDSELWMYNIDGTTIGVLAILEQGENHYEVMNVAVHPAHQRQGIGKKLLQHALQTLPKGSVIRICTGNSSTHQLKLYQQVGFELVDVQWNYFIEHYNKPIFEDGIRCQHQMVLEQSV